MYSSIAESISESSPVIASTCEANNVMEFDSGKPNRRGGFIPCGTDGPKHLSRLSPAVCGHPFDFRLIFAYHLSVEQPNGAPGKIIYLGACLIAAVRLAREENWNNSPRVVSRISDAISLAKRIYDRMKVDYPALR